MYKKLLAFTLAEVMLTMTIVGVVAALTIPTLHYQRVKKEYSAKLKNFYSKINNAVLDMEMDKGSFRDMQIPAQGQGYRWYMDNIDPYVGHEFADDTEHVVYYKDGSKLFQFQSGGCLDVQYDVNGDKAPNRLGYDRQYFLFCFTQAGRQQYFGNNDIFFGTYGGSSGQDGGREDLVAAGVSRDVMINECRTAAYKCGRLLQNDQWEFKSDYPYKF